MLEYEIIKRPSRTALEQGVDYEISEGWLPLGQPFRCIDELPDDLRYWFQAMTRTDEARVKAEVRAQNREPAEEWK